MSRALFNLKETLRFLPRQVAMLGIATLCRASRSGRRTTATICPAIQAAILAKNPTKTRKKVGVLQEKVYSSRFTTEKACKIENCDERERK